VDREKAVERLTYGLGLSFRLGHDRRAFGQKRVKSLVVDHVLEGHRLRVRFDGPKGLVEAAY
jgi:hypothetical protein